MRCDIVHRVYGVQTRRAEDIGLTVAHPDNEPDFPDAQSETACRLLASVLKP
jgi:hypothetical protein